MFTTPDLQWNALGSTACSKAFDELVKSLKDNHSLIHLDLSNNQIASNKLSGGYFDTQRSKEVNFGKRNMSASSVVDIHRISSGMYLLFQAPSIQIWRLLWAAHLTGNDTK